MIVREEMGYCGECGNEIGLWQVGKDKHGSDRFIAKCRQCGHYNDRSEILKTRTKLEKQYKIYTENNTTIYIKVVQSFLPGKNVTPYRGVEL